MCLPFLSELEPIKISGPCLSLNTEKGSELFFMCLLYQFQQFLDTFPIEPPFLYEIDLIYNERKLPICKDKKAQNIFHAFATFFLQLFPVLDARDH